MVGGVIFEITVLDDADEPGNLGSFAWPWCGKVENFARKGKRTRKRKSQTAAGTVKLVLWHVGCRVVGECSRASDPSG